jgi:hypothetical protein
MEIHLLKKEKQFYNLGKTERKTFATRSKMNTFFLSLIVQPRNRTKNLCSEFRLESSLDFSLEKKFNSKKGDIIHLENCYLISGSNNPMWTIDDDQLHPLYWVNTNLEIHRYLSKSILERVKNSKMIMVNSNLVLFSGFRIGKNRFTLECSKDVDVRHSFKLEEGIIWEIDRCFKYDETFEVYTRPNSNVLYHIISD